MNTNTRKKLMIGLVVLGIIVVVIGLGLILSNTITKPKDDDNKNPDSDPNQIINLSCYSCSREQLAKDTYTIDYTYEFCYKDDELNYGNYYYVYTFNDLNSYQNFQFEKSDQFDPIDVKEDESNLTRTYTFDLSYPTEGKTIDSYVETLQGWGYTCSTK